MKKTIEFSIDPQGWVKLQRSLLDSPIMKNPTLLQIYIWSKLRANHQPKWFSIKVGKGIKEIYCDVGQFITGRKRAAEELSIAQSTFYKNIKKLEDYGYLTIEANNHFSLITVVTADSLEVMKKPSEQQIRQKSNNNATAKEQLKNTNNNDKKEKKENKKIKNNIISNSNFNKKIKLKKKENSNIQNWTIKAHEKLLNIIKRDYSKVNLIPHKISIDEFKELFSKYDWEDIMDKCEALENWPHIQRQLSVYKILKIFFQNDETISVLDGVEENSYISYRLYNENMDKQWEEEEKQKRLADGYYDEIKEDYKSLLKEFKDTSIWDQFDLTSHKNSKRKVIKSYLRFKFLLSQYKKVAEAYKLNNFMLKHYLRFANAGFRYEELRYYINQFVKWPKRKNYKNIYKGYGEFMVEIMDSGQYEH